MFRRQEKDKYPTKDQLEEFIRAISVSTHELISAAQDLRAVTERATKVGHELKTTVERAEKVGARLRSSGPKSGW